MAKHRPGRKKRPCKANYNACRRWVENKVKRVIRHLKKCPDDKQAKAILAKIT